MKPRPHTFLSDPTVPADHRGRRVCQACGLPARHETHREPATDDVSARVLGESGEADG